MNLINGDCLEELKKIPDKSVDFVYTDLPYNQTACKWDQNVIDLDALWVQLKRIAKNDRTPFFFSCTTKFGYNLIKANEKWFRWDLVWKKNRAAGFLNAYKLPMRKHEMVYCFAKKCPDYDVSDHLTGEEVIKKADSNHIFLRNNRRDHKCFQKPHKSKTLKYPLPTTDITPPTPEHELVYCFAKKCPEYDVSSHKELLREKKNIGTPTNDVYGTPLNIVGKIYKDPLPTTDITPPTPEHELVYCFAKKCPEYDVSSHKEYTEKKGEYINATDSQSTNSKCKTTKTTSKTHKDPLPTSDITPPELDPNGHADMYGVSKTGKRNQGKKDQERLPTSDITLPPIDIDIDEEQPPSSWCEVNNDEKTGHRTAKPVALMEFLLKYWTKPGWTVLDPTMGSGSMGIACKKMGRNFIGMEMDDDIYKLAQKRVSEAVVPPK